MKIIIRNNQSLLDVAVQYRGTAEAAFEIALANNLSITEDLKTGQELIIPNTRYYNKIVSEYYEGKGFLPATSISDDFISNLVDLGIGEMIININFKPKALKNS